MQTETAADAAPHTQRHHTPEDLDMSAQSPLWLDAFREFRWLAVLGEQFQPDGLDRRADEKITASLRYGTFGRPSDAAGAWVLVDPVDNYACKWKAARQYDAIHADYNQESSADAMIRSEVGGLHRAKVEPGRPTIFHEKLGQWDHERGIFRMSYADADYYGGRVMAEAALTRMLAWLWLHDEDRYEAGYEAGLELGRRNVIVAGVAGALFGGAAALLNRWAGGGAGVKVEFGGSPPDEDAQCSGCGEPFMSGTGDPLITVCAECIAAQAHRYAGKVAS